MSPLQLLRLVPDLSAVDLGRTIMHFAQSSEEAIAPPKREGVRSGAVVETARQGTPGGAWLQT